MTNGGGTSGDKASDGPNIGSPGSNGPDYGPGFWLWHATLRWQREITAVLAPLDLTHVQFVLLSCAWWLNGRGQVPNQLALARQAGTDVKMTSEVVRKLAAKGLLARETDPHDTRARRLRVTPAGERVARQAIADVERADQAFFAAAAAGGDDGDGLDSDQIAALLRRLAEAPYEPPQPQKPLQPQKSPCVVERPRLPGHGG